MDSAAMAPAAAQEFERLVYSGGITAPGEFYSNSPRPQEYEITIEDGRRTITVIYDDLSVPEAAKPLLGYLKQHAELVSPC
ncbi:MAG: hypothetical protein U0X20_15735 [Caldilineaceae bacterium]